MTPYCRFIASLDSDTEPMFWIEFRKIDLMVIKQALRAHSIQTALIKLPEKGCWRIELNSREHTPEVVWQFFNVLPHI